jgi:hypothetical protein
MSSTLQPPDTPPGAGRPADDVDDLLQAFFRAELPAPWPTLDPHRAGGPPTTGTGPSPRRRILLWGRFTLAAAVALVVIGYWALAGRFPAPPTNPGAALIQDRDLGLNGNRLRGKAVERTRHGGEAILKWEQSPDGLFMHIEETSPPKR